MEKLKLNEVNYTDFLKVIKAQAWDLNLDFLTVKSLGLLENRAMKRMHRSK